MSMISLLIHLTDQPTPFKKMLIESSQPNKEVIHRSCLHHEPIIHDSKLRYICVYECKMIEDGNG